MHPIFFSIKRAFHKSTWIGRRILHELQLTPSRFDVLFVLQKHGGMLHQSALRRILGVSAPTVSRMLDALVELGFLVRRRPPEDQDQRQREIELTERGARRIALAVMRTMSNGLAHALVSYFTSRHWWQRKRADADVFHAEYDLVFARDRLCDTATVDYDWCSVELPFTRDADEVPSVFDRYFH